MFSRCSPFVSNSLLVFSILNQYYLSELLISEKKMDVPTAPKVKNTQF